MLHEKPTDHQDLLKSYEQLTDDQDKDFQATKNRQTQISSLIPDY